MYNLSLKEGVVPFEWEEVSIITLFKKDSRNKSDNYRPVSLTSVICKLLERLIKNHMVYSLVRHKLLKSSQHGFLKARSYLTNVLCFLEEVNKWIDEGSPVDIIYLPSYNNEDTFTAVQTRPADHEDDTYTCLISFSQPSAYPLGNLRVPPGNPRRTPPGKPVPPGGTPAPGWGSLL